MGYRDILSPCTVKYFSDKSESELSLYFSWICFSKDFHFPWYVKKRLFYFSVRFIIWRNARNIDEVISREKSFFVQPVGFLYKTLHSVAHHTVADLFTYRNSESVPICSIIQNIEYERSVRSGLSFFVHAAEIRVLLETVCKIHLLPVKNSRIIADNAETDPWFNVLIPFFAGKSPYACAHLILIYHIKEVK